MNSVLKFLLVGIIIFTFSAPSFSQNDFGGGVLEYTANKNQESVSVGLKMIGYIRGHDTRYSGQLNFFNYEWIPDGRYNGDSTITSITSLYNWLWICATGLTRLSVFGDENGMVWFDAVVFGPALLINSQHGYILLNTSTGQKSFFTASVYFKSKLDIFDHKNLFDYRENRWLRYKPGLGVELTQVFSNEKNTSKGLAVDIGVDKPFDYVYSTWKSNDWTPMISFKFLLGSNSDS